MSILQECPECHKKQKINNKKCKCGQNLDQAKKSKRIKYWISYRLSDGKQKRKAVGAAGLKSYSIEDARYLHTKLTGSTTQITPNTISETVYTYFIKAGDTNHVKIGISIDIKQRLAMLQIGNHKKLKLIGYLLGNKEKKMHRKFKKCWTQGEWFTFTKKEFSIVSNITLPFVDIMEEK